MTFLRRALTIAITAALGLVLVLTTAMFLGILPRQAYLVESDSMAPAIQTGDLVIVDTSADPQPGDVISYAIGGGKVVTHRLLDINPDGSLVSKGDAMNQLDPFTATTDDIIGEVTTVIPGAAPILGFLTSPAGILSSIAIVLGATVLLAALTGRRDDHNDEEPNTDTTEQARTLEPTHA